MRRLVYKRLLLFLIYLCWSFQSLGVDGWATARASGH